MRYFVGLFVLTASTVVAQTNRNPVFDYLKLTPAQVAALQANAAAFLPDLQANTSLVDQTNAALVDQLAKPDLDEAALGAEYAAIEFVCRSINAGAQRLSEQNLAVLTPDQKTLLDGVAAKKQDYVLLSNAMASNLTQSSSSVVSSGLLLTGTVYGTGIFGIYGVPTYVPDPSLDLALYLGITSAQLDKLRKLNSAYSADMYAQSVRLSEIRASIADEVRQDVPSSATLAECTRKSKNDAVK